VAPLLVVEAEEAVEIRLELLHRAVELLPVYAEELLLERAVEALAEAIGLRRSDGGSNRRLRATPAAASALLIS
jgi:hypothetical protein